MNNVKIEKRLLEKFGIHHVINARTLVRLMSLQTRQSESSKPIMWINSN